MKSFKVLLLAGLIGASFQAAADVKIDLNQDIQPVMINGDELGFSLTSKKEFTLDNGQNQIVVRVEKLVQNRGEYEKFNSSPIVVTFNAEDTDLVITPSVNIVTTEDSKKFEEKPQVIVKDSKNKTITVQQGKLEPLTGFTRDYEKELAAYNKSNNIALAATAAGATGVAVTDKQAQVVSKPQEMVEYWYEEATSEEKQAFSSWAFQNRKEVTTDLKSTGKPSEMLDYWYKKASLEQRSAILTWLLKVE